MVWGEGYFVRAVDGVERRGGGGAEVIPRDEQHE